MSLPVKRFTIVVLLAALALISLQAQAKRVLVLCLDPRQEASSLRLATGLAKAGYAVSRSAPATVAALESSLAAFESKAGARDSCLFYLIGSAFHSGPITYLSGPGWSYCLDELFRRLDPLENGAKAANRYLVLDLCRVGPRPPKPAFLAGVGPLVEPPPGTAALVPASAGRLLSPDEDDAGLVASAFLELLGAYPSDLLGHLRALGRSLDQAGAGRLAPRLYGQVIVEEASVQGSASLWGFRLGDSPAAVLKALGLDPAIALGPAAELEGGIAWKPQAGSVPASMYMPWRGFFDQEEGMSLASSGGTETYSELVLEFLDGRLGRISLNAASTGPGIAGRSWPMFRHESSLRYLEGRLSRTKREASKPFNYMNRFASAQTGEGSTLDYYFEDVGKFSRSELFQGPGYRFTLNSTSNGVHAGDRDKIDTYGELVYRIRLESDAAKNWK